MALTWLLDGSGDKLDVMLDEARWLLEQHEQHEVAKEEELKELWDVVQHERARWEAAGLVELCRKRKELEMQLEFLHLHRALEQLRASRLPEEISALVMTVVKHLPAQLPKQSHFNQRLREVVQEQRQRLLASFHAQFETHLEQPNEAQQSVHLWSAFLESGKSWLLSFALVTLLPLRLGESSQRSLEVLQRDVLEEALVPLWGRFRYHLAAARESSEEEQVLWTFVYSKSHVELLCSLCTQLTAAPALQQLGGGSRPGALQEAATAHVAETAIRLLRAHVALLLVSPSVSASVAAVLTSTASSEGNEAGGAGAGAGAGAGVPLMRLIEACLDIDQHLFPLLPVGTRDCIPLTVHVVCDHRPSLEAWARCDSSVLCGPRSQVCESFSSWGAAFSSAFVNLWAPAAPAAAPASGASVSASGAGALVANEAAAQGEVGDRKFCYRSTYACLSSLSLACSRYKLLPRKGQTALVRAVVLPLLAALLATLLLRMRSCPALLASPSSSGGAASEEDIDFSLALSYADRALQTLLINGAGNIASPDAAALTDLWAAVSSWVPRTVSPEVEALMVEDYAVTPNTLLRRVLDWAAASAAGAGPDAGGDAGAAGAGRVDLGAGDGELLAGAIETARHIALTLRAH